jgi:hypothetical protein
MRKPLEVYFLNFEQALAVFAGSGVALPLA